jgi:hypothetical protein
MLQNGGSNPMWIEFGSARATCSLTGTAISTSFTITNAGFGFTKPPTIRFLGGGSAGNSDYLGLNQPNGPAPSNVATATCTLSGGAVNAITLSNPGANYVTAPYMFFQNSDLDPYGCAVPAAGTGYLLTASTPLIFNGTCCTTDAVAVFGTSGDKLIVRWMD